MKKCPNCGKELDDSVKFCTGCGTKIDNADLPKEQSTVGDAEPVVPPVQTNAANTTPPKEKKPVDFKLFDKCFWVLYIVVGALSYLCVELGGLYTGVSAGFTIFLGVMSLIFVLAFAAIAVVRKIATQKESEEDRAKHALRDNICLAVSAVILIYVVIAAIGLFNIAHTIIEASKVFVW